MFHRYDKHHTEGMLMSFRFDGETRMSIAINLFLIAVIVFGIMMITLNINSRYHAIVARDREMKLEKDTNSLAYQARLYEEAVRVPKDKECIQEISEAGRNDIQDTERISTAGIERGLRYN